MTIKVLIIDDSALARQVLSQILASDPDIEVVGTASDAHIALNKIRTLNPQVLILELKMQEMDGLVFLERLMKTQPLPVVVVSTLGQKDAPASVAALKLGAVSVIAKPKADLRHQLQELSAEIIQAVKTAPPVKTVRTRPETPASAVSRKQTEMSVSRSSTPYQVIAFGASTGGTEALMEVLKALPPGIPPIVIVQHMPPGFTRSFAAMLNDQTALSVKEAVTGDILRSGHVLLAPGDQHMVLKTVGNGLFMVELHEGEPVNRHRPSVDVLFHSVASVVGKQALGIIMTGMGNDGAQGLLEMKQAGAQTIAQDEKSCVVFGMPKIAIQKGAVDFVLPLSAISFKVLSLTGLI
ncbi:MAG: chemotaxis response regulator protein-glutamate methylesterase [SAR324 cluster bacterium]|nr:chemotaxis response regulator protein-glutamate methylesterase [SAR324 cluster bacterium]